VIGAPAARTLRAGLVAAAIAVPAGRLAAEPDLQLHRAPPRLKMRAAPAPKAADAPGPSSVARGASADGKRVASADAAPDANADRGDQPAVAAFTPLPRSTRELAERVTFRLRAGVELESAPASGDALRGGAALPPGFSDSRSWIVGDAMVGARDMLLPSLGGYLLSSFQFDASDALATRSALVSPGDAADQRIAIKAGYVEWGNDDRRPQTIWLRGGRQFRLDAGAMFAYFDGVTAGYRARGTELSAFVGQRVVLYVNSEPGVEFGATAAVDLLALRGTPVKLALDYMGLAINQPAASGGDETQLRQLIALTGSYEPTSKLRAELRARAVDGDGSGLALGRIGGRLKLTPSDKLMVIGDIEQRQGGDLAYDLAAPSAVDVVDVARKLGVGLAAPIDALTIGARVDLRRKDGELLVFARAEVPESTPTSVDQQGWFEGGAAVAGQALAGAWITAQYTGRQYLRESGANMATSAFGDTAGSGLDRLHELAVEASLRSQTRGGARWRVGAGGFYRIYDLVTPYRTASSDGRGGGRAELSWWFTQMFHAELAAELAQSSPVLAREIGTMSSIRGTLEARW
jgi:hypothetical protein